MIFNLAVSTTIGIVPGLGAILVAAYRANVRNARLLENFLAARVERAGKAAQSVTSEQTRRGTTEYRDKGKGDCERQGKTGEMAEEKPSAAKSTLDGEGEKEKEKESTITDGDEKDKNATAAPDPDITAEGDQRRYLRPTRDTLEYVQNRDSRFIEDVS